MTYRYRRTTKRANCRCSRATAEEFRWCRANRRRPISGDGGSVFLASQWVAERLQAEQPILALFAGQTRLWSATEHGLDPQIARQMLGILELIHEAQYVERAVKVIPPDRHQPEAFTGTPEPDSEWESKA